MEEQKDRIKISRIKRHCSDKIKMKLLVVAD